METSLLGEGILSPRRCFRYRPNRFGTRLVALAATILMASVAGHLENDERFANNWQTPRVERACGVRG